MDAEHDAIYRQCLEAAKRDFDALHPQLQELQRVINNLRRIILALKDLTGDTSYEEIYDWPILKGQSSATLWRRPAGRTQNEAHHEKGG